MLSREHGPCPPRALASEGYIRLLTEHISATTTLPMQAKPNRMSRERDEDLEQGLKRMRRRLDHLPLRLHHFSADLAFYGFLSAAWEAAAVCCELVTKSRFPSAALPNAQAAFEAAQDALLLASAPDYDVAGARAIVFERLVRAAGRADYGESLVREGVLAPATDQDEYEWATADIRTAAERIGRVAPDQREHLEAALQYLLPKFAATHAMQSARPVHWAEVHPTLIGRELQRRLGEPGLEHLQIGTALDFSRSSPLRFSTEHWASVQDGEPARLHARTTPTLRLGLGAAGIAFLLAERALKVFDAGPGATHGPSWGRETG